MAASSLSSPSSCCVIPAGNALPRQICALPALPCGERGHPRTSFYQFNLSFSFSWSGLWGCCELGVPTHGEVPVLSHSLPCPSFPRPSPCQGPAGAWPELALGSSGCCHRAGQMAGRARHILQKATVGSFCFAAWSFSFRFPGCQGVSGSGRSPAVIGKASNIPQGGLRVVPCPVLASPWDRLDSPLELLGMDKPIKNPAQYKKKEKEEPSGTESRAGG